MKIAFYTLGCKVNQYDTATMIECFKNSGHEIVEFNDLADCYVINTCTVTAISDKKSRQIISRANEKNSDAIICVAGCFAQNDADEALKLPGVSVVIGTSNRGKIVEIVESLERGEKINAVKSVENDNVFEDLPAVAKGRTRAVLKIQEGCDRFCSYCIIPYARGAKKNRSLEGISREAKRLSAAGFKEFVLTGIHLSSYESGDGKGLISAMKIAAKVEGVERIRVGSLEASIIDREFAEYVAYEDKVCKHFHLSLQSGSDAVLKRMNRKYNSSEYSQKIDMLRELMPEAAFTTDIITGFPAESEAEHEASLEFIKAMRLYKVHVFPYSERKGTIAATMPNQVETGIRRKRASEIIAASKLLEKDFLTKAIGKEEYVLVEKKNEDFVFGYTRNYIPINIREKHEVNEIIKVEIEGLSGLELYGKSSK